MISADGIPERAGFFGVLLALAACFVALGLWQIERRAWKHELVAAVESRIHAPAVPAPDPDAWRTINAEHDAYRRVTVTGRYVPGHETLVRGVSDLGAGYWVITPFDTGDFIVLINRGFITPEQRRSSRREPEGDLTVTGLLRMSEPGGGFLRDNDPKTDNWYSRDVAGIGAARGIVRSAPYFIDADAVPGGSNGPVGGLTVVRFADNHAAYALTWFAMALLSAFAAWRIVPRNRFIRRAFA
ncbi:SURF1 family protein [Novosphingobium sp. G106]|uniref:SURF1 family protein n=1 Tax=Novosphingobium sp. G106 TaxID=2849500 RepID=UPI0028118B92|nr:SURF1 family protein [Novosphingobium sp. G106]